MAVKIAFVDDYDISRNVFSALLKKLPDVELVLICASGEELLQKIGDHEVQMVITDLYMPGMNGPEMVAHLSNLYPQIGCIAISSYDNEDIIQAFIRAGGKGYLSKEANLSEFEKAVVAVSFGGMYFKESIRKLLP